MRQQINLFQDILIDKPAPLQGRQAGYLLLITILCLVLISVYSLRQTTVATAERDELRSQIQSEMQRVTALEQAFPEVKKSVLLETKIGHLKREIEGQRQALNYFLAQDVNSNSAILETLEALARTPYQGVWLKRIRLLAQGNEAFITGRALVADQVPDYLALLASKDVFGGRVFSVLRLSRVEDQFGPIDFLLKSSSEEPK